VSHRLCGLVTHRPRWGLSRLGWLCLVFLTALSSGIFALGAHRFFAVTEKVELTDYDPRRAPLFAGLSVTAAVRVKEPATGEGAGEFLQPYSQTTPSSTPTTAPASAPATRP